MPMMNAKETYVPDYMSKPNCVNHRHNFRTCVSFERAVQHKYSLIVVYHNLDQVILSSLLKTKYNPEKILYSNS